KRGSVDEAESQHPAVFILENPLRPAARVRPRAAGKRKRRATSSTPDRIGKSAGQRLLRARGHAGAETYPESNQNRKRGEGPGAHLRTWRDWRRVHRAGSGFAARRARARAKRSRAIIAERGIASPSP